MSKSGVSFDVPAEGRKQLSKRRNVGLPLDEFTSDQETAVHTNYTLTTPIGKALRGTSKSTDTLESKPEKYVKFRIYLSRLANEHGTPSLENGIELTIDAGSKADSNILLSHLSAEYKIPFDVFCEFFSLWMISPLLEVQLKSYHRPYECRQGWTILLDRFADKSQSSRVYQDEPILMLRRNASLDSEREFELLEDYPQCAPFLVTDVRERILLDRVHFSCIDDITKVAGMLFCLQYGAFDSSRHDVAFVRNNIEDILAERLCDMIVGTKLFGKSIYKKTPKEEKLISYWQECPSYGDQNRQQIELLKTLSQVSSCYGSAWFTALIEKKTSRVNVRNFGQGFTPTKANVGINDRWITIIDAESNEVLLVLSIEEMSWKLESSKEDEEPYILLNLSPDEVAYSNGNSPSTEVAAHETVYFLMIFGKQTTLIDALLTSLLGRKLDRSVSESASSTDSSTSSGRHASMIRRLQSKNCTTLNNKKLCMAKFQDGKCTEVAGSFKNVFTEGHCF